MKKIILSLIVMLIIFFIIIFVINYYVRIRTKNKIISEEDATNLQDVDCILVLGAATWGNSPSPMLEDRILQSIALYQNGTSCKIIMSGDHTRKNYDEVNVMKQYAIDKGVPSSDIFMDHAGISTYDSVYRAKEIFDVKKMVIVTQEYHLYRALYIADNLNVEAYGVASDPRKYKGQIFREVREILARDKDCLKCIFKPQSAFLGEKIALTGDGNVTNK